MFSSLDAQVRSLWMDKIVWKGADVTLQNVIGCTSEKSMDKIIWKGGDVTLQNVIEILQVEDCTLRALQEIISNMK